MESIKKLREICQASRKKVDTWHGRNIARRISIYITVIFLKIGISANVATLIFLLSGILGALMLANGSRSMVLFGSLMLQIWYILDHVDGEVARYRKETSLTGAYFDHISHYIVHPLIFFALGVGLFFRTEEVSMVVLGIFAGLSITIIGAISDIYSLFTKEEKNGKGESLGEKSTSSLRKLFSYLHWLCTFPIVIDILLIFAILDLILDLNLVSVFLVFYALCATSVWLAKLFYIITTKKLDKSIKKKEV